MNLNESFLPTGFMVYGLATMVANFLAKGEQSDLSPLLDTIAFGVPVYRDIHIGSNHFPRDLVRDFLQLRVYHVDYNYQPVFRTNLVVTDLVKGSADDTSLCLDRDVLHQYWLA